MTITRRGFLEGAALGAGALATGQLSGCSSSTPTDEVFPQGVASGDPSPDGVLLWARVAPETGPVVAVSYVVATDAELRDEVASGELSATAESDHTVRARVAGLAPATTYYYRFEAAGTGSNVARTRTAPEPDADVPARFAVTSCQDFVGRYYHAWQAVLDEDIDFVLFLGDYIYETVADPRLQTPRAGRTLSVPDGISLDGTDENVAAFTLADYRALYRQYKTDAWLRAAHERFPFVIIWDDHEFVNDCWQDHANEFDGERGDELETSRREAATRAWFEYLPVDLAYDSSAGFPADIQTYRSLRYGKHAELALTDQRYYRDDHVVPEGPIDERVGKFLMNSPLGSRLFALKDGFDLREAEVSPTMLGAGQRDWLLETLSTSSATFKLWASGLMVAQLVMDLRAEAGVVDQFKNLYYFKLDQWDGFRTERAEILRALASTPNVVVLSGDLHGFYAAELKEDFDDLAVPATATEITVGSISAETLFGQIDKQVNDNILLNAAGLGSVTPRIDEIILASGPHFRYAESKQFGFVVIEANATELTAELFLLPDVTSTPDFDGSLERVRFRIPAGEARIERV